MAMPFILHDKVSVDRPQVEINSLSHYIDKEEKLNINHLLLNDDVLSEVTQNPTRFGHNPNTIWLKIVATNPLNYAETWVINTSNKQILSAKLYELVSRNNLPSYNLLYQHNNPRIQNLPYFTADVATKVTFQAGESKTLYLSYHSLMSTHLHVNFDYQNDAMEQHTEETLNLFVVIAILFVLVFINFVFYFSLQKNQYLYYCLQLLLIITLLLIFSGYSIKFFHDNNAGLAQSLVIVCLLLMVSSSMLFINTFLDLRRISFRLASIARFYMLAAVVFIPLSLWTESKVLMLQYVTPLFVFSFSITAFLLGCAAVYRGQHYAIPYCIAWVVLGCSVAITLMSFIDIFHVNVSNHIYPAYIGLVIEGALLSVSMGLKVATMRKQNDVTNKKLISIYQDRSQEAEELQRAFIEKEIAIGEKIKKNKDLASATHDINHNLFLIKLNVDSLKNDANQIDIQATQASLQSLQEITENILHTARLEHSLQLQGIQMSLFFQQLCQSMSAITEHKNIELRYRCGDIRLNASTVILKRILENLLRNALQHTHRGGVLLVIRERSDHYKIQVIDTGIGIHKDRQDYIQRAFSCEETDKKGYGMGLYIVSNLCLQAGYVLTIASTLGRGSIFTIKINKERLPRGL